MPVSAAIILKETISNEFSTLTKLTHCLLGGSNKADNSYETLF